MLGCHRRCWGPDPQLQQGPPQVMLSQRISADSVAGRERGGRVSCPPPVLARLREEAHGDSTSPRPVCLIALQPGGTLPGRDVPGGSVVLSPAFLAEGKMYLNTLRCFLGVCMWSVSGLALLFHPSRWRNRWFHQLCVGSQNKLCFLAVTFQ